jgi:uncharacterized Zn-binding protein involved in type VI secretion
MPPVARGEGGDGVFSLTGSGRRCQSPINTVTGECSNNVFVNNKGIIRQGDKVGVHNASGCSTDQSGLTTFSGSVFANNLEIARIGDEYTSDNVITSGSSNVFAA